VEAKKATGRVVPIPNRTGRMPGVQETSMTDKDEDELVYRVTGNDKPITRGLLNALLATMNDPSKSIEERSEAASAAAPYMHPLAPGNKHEDDEEQD
jgi:hypothetical protein